MTLTLKCVTWAEEIKQLLHYFLRLLELISFLSLQLISVRSWKSQAEPRQWSGLRRSALLSQDGVRGSQKGLALRELVSVWMPSPNADKESTSDSLSLSFSFLFPLVLFISGSLWGRIPACPWACRRNWAQQKDVSFMSLHTSSFFFLSLPPSLQPAHYHHGLSTNEEDMIPRLCLHLSKPKRKRDVLWISCSC